jgi:hypothetical protein
MRKRTFILDERERNIYRDLITVLYLITLVALIGMQLYRQFVLGQPSEQWDDIALLVTFNILFLLGGGLFLSGAVNLKKIKIRNLVLGYAAFVLIGLLFTILKYAVLFRQKVGLDEVWDYFLIILPITAGLVIGWGILSYLGHRHMEKKLE